MRQFEIIENRVKLIIEGNVLAVLSASPLCTVSSAIYNGGFQKTKAILNVQVPAGYGDRQLHENPELLVSDSSKKIGVTENFVGLITAAVVENFSSGDEERG